MKKQFEIKSAHITTNYEQGNFQIDCIDDLESSELINKLEPIMYLRKPIKLIIFYEVPE